ncbi:MAG: lysophospholipid acyltransferase family protein [Saprospiraceae bacterium]|nr:lysophospholipid acyltransferase family protein [Saprospiraceae bacterium]
MPIVTETDIVRNLRLQRYGVLGTSVTKTMMDILGINALNQLYDQHCHLEGLAFIDAILDKLSIRIEISENDLKRLPASGPFILVSNHPLGGIDGLIMLKIMLLHHPESKIIANYLLKLVQPLDRYVCPVNPFEHNKELYHSFGGIRTALDQLKSGFPLGIFPAGEVSVRQKGIGGRIDDKKWDVSMIKLIKKAGVPVIPMFFNARNSDLFYIMAGVNGYLRTAKLPSEMLNSYDKTIKVRIGNPISVTTQDSMKDIDVLSDHIRHKTYILGNVFRKRKFFELDISKFKKGHQPVLARISPEHLERDFSLLRQDQKILFESGHYALYFTKLDDYPMILAELGRLREITFRDAGEGTGKATDVDKYDAYYHHLILWDKSACQLAGAYRLGLGKEIKKMYGMSGFYMSELFYLYGPMHDVMNESIEMGRAFVAKPYQQRPMPLFLLWKGIEKIATSFPEYKYLIGAASISNSYSYYSRSMMVEYFSKHHFDSDLALYVAAKKPFRSMLTKKDADLIGSSQFESIRSVDRLIEELEPQGLKIPVLIKKYLLQNAKLLAFNVDTAFNDAIDGLIYIEISKINLEKLG